MTLNKRIWNATISIYLFILTLSTCQTISTTQSVTTIDGNSESITSEDQTWYEYIWEQLQQDSIRYYLLLLFIIIFLAISLISCIDARCIRVNDFFKVGIIAVFTLQILDLVTDIFFIIDVNSTYKDFIKIEEYDNNEANQLLIMQIISIACLVIAVVISIIQLYYTIQKHWVYDDKIRAWLYNNGTLLYFGSFFCGSSFTATYLFNSNILGFDIFDMGLRSNHMLNFMSQRLYSTIFFESIPQVTMQIWYGVLADFSLITILSMIFSIISIIVTLFAILTKQQMYVKQDFLNIWFDVIGESVVQKSKKCKNNLKGIRKQLSLILGKEENVIEIQRPYIARKGLRVRIIVSILGGGADEMIIVDQSREQLEQDPSYFLKILNDANSDGSLAQCFYKKWKLESTPKIMNIHCALIESTLKERRKQETKKKIIDSSAKIPGLKSERKQYSSLPTHDEEEKQQQQQTDKMEMDHPFVSESEHLKTDRAGSRIEGEQRARIASKHQQLGIDTETMPMPPYQSVAVTAPPQRSHVAQFAIHDTVTKNVLGIQEEPQTKTKAKDTVLDIEDNVIEKLPPPQISQMVMEENVTNNVLEKQEEQQTKAKVKETVLEMDDNVTETIPIPSRPSPQPQIAQLVMEDDVTNNGLEIEKQPQEKETVKETVLEIEDNVEEIVMEDNIDGKDIGDCSSAQIMM